MAQVCLRHNRWVQPQARHLVLGKLYAPSGDSVIFVIDRNSVCPLWDAFGPERMPRRRGDCNAVGGVREMREDFTLSFGTFIFLNGNSSF